MLYIHTTVKRIVHGSGCIKNAPAEARRLGGTRALIGHKVIKAGVSADERSDNCKYHHQRKYHIYML